MIRGVEHDLSELARRIGDARRLTVITGAGVSAASGVPTFRGAGGLWRTYRPEDLATRDAFERDPGLVWEWYAWRREKVASCAPNAAHAVLARWSASAEASPGQVSRDVCIVTQNVDDLHVRAGTHDLIRLHGSLWELKCFEGCTAGARPWRDERVPLPDALPRCPYCGGYARPAVVWFGESLDPDDVNQALDATACDVFLTVGTSAVVYPAAGFARHAQSRGAFTAEINLEPTPASSLVDLTIRGGAEEVLPLLDVAVANHGATKTRR
jgi:NAD-dependent deacetylase